MTNKQEWKGSRCGLQTIQCINQDSHGPQQRPEILTFQMSHMP